VCVFITGEGESQNKGKQIWSNEDEEEQRLILWACVGAKKSVWKGKETCAQEEWGRASKLYSTSTARESGDRSRPTHVARCDAMA